MNEENEAPYPYPCCQCGQLAKFVAAEINPGSLALPAYWCIPCAEKQFGQQMDVMDLVREMLRRQKADGSEP